MASGLISDSVPHVQLAPFFTFKLGYAAVYSTSTCQTSRPRTVNSLEGLPLVAKYLDDDSTKAYLDQDYRRLKGCLYSIPVSGQVEELRDSASGQGKHLVVHSLIVFLLDF